MRILRLTAVLVLTVLVSACASRQNKSEPAAQPSQAATASPAVQGEIVGKPAPGSKFSKLKIGMTLPQVVKLIGQPTKQWQHPTGKASIPFYFGPDRWLLKYSYKGEGQLTFNYGGDQLLTRIEVNKAE